MAAWSSGMILASIPGAAPFLLCHPSRTPHNTNTTHRYTHYQCPCVPHPLSVEGDRSVGNEVSTSNTRHQHHVFSFLSSLPMNRVPQCVSGVSYLHRAGDRTVELLELSSVSCRWVARLLVDRVCGVECFSCVCLVLYSDFVGFGLRVTFGVYYGRVV